MGMDSNAGVPAGGDLIVAAAPESGNGAMSLAEVPLPPQIVVADEDEAIALAHAFAEDAQVAIWRQREDRFYLVESYRPRGSAMDAAPAPAARRA